MPPTRLARRCLSLFLILSWTACTDRPDSPAGPADPVPDLSVIATGDVFEAPGVDVLPPVDAGSDEALGPFDPALSLVARICAADSGDGPFEIGDPPIQVPCDPMTDPVVAEIEGEALVNHYLFSWRTRNLGDGDYTIGIYLGETVLALVPTLLNTSGSSNGGGNSSRTEPIKVFVEQGAACAAVFGIAEGINPNTSSACALDIVPYSGGTITAYQDPSCTTDCVEVLAGAFQNAWYPNVFGAEDKTVAVLCYDAETYPQAIDIGEGPPDVGGAAAALTPAWLSGATRFPSFFPVFCKVKVEPPINPGGGPGQQNPLVQGKVAFKVCPVDEDAAGQQPWHDEDSWVAKLGDDGKVVVPPLGGDDPDCVDVIWQPVGGQASRVWSDVRGRLAAAWDWLAPQPLKAAVAALRDSKSSLLSSLSELFHAAPSAIEGYVGVVDDAGDPVVNPGTGLPYQAVAGATVTVYDQDATPNLLATTTTDANGFYSFDELPCSLEPWWANFNPSNPSGPTNSAGTYDCEGRDLDYTIVASLPGSASQYLLVRPSKDLCLYQDFVDGEFDPTNATACAEDLEDDARSQTYGVDFGAIEVGFGTGSEWDHRFIDTGAPPVDIMTWSKDATSSAPLYLDVGSCFAMSNAAGVGGTSISGWNGKNNERSVLLARQSFTVPAGAAGATFYLKASHADDAQVWLNGVNITANILSSGPHVGEHTGPTSAAQSKGLSNTGKPEKHDTRGTDAYPAESGRVMQQHSGCPPPIGHVLSDGSVLAPNGDVVYQGSVQAGTNTVVVVLANRSGKGSYFDAAGVVVP